MSMRKSLMVLVAMSPLCLLSPASYADSGKIGFVNVPEIMAKAPQAVAARHELRKEFKPREKQLNDLRSEIQKEGENLKRNAAAMSAERKKNAEQDLLKKEVAFNSDLKSFRKDFASKRDALLKGLQKRISDVILHIAKRDHYDMIMGEGVVYANDRVNLTKRVLDELKK